MADGKAKMSAPTVWPEFVNVSKPTKDLLQRLFDLLDDKSDNVGDRLADEVMTPDGYLGAYSGAASGSAEIRNARKNAWTRVEHRKHVINRVYANSDREFFFLGHFEVRTKTGREFDDDFAGQVVIDDPNSANPKIRIFTVFVDTQTVNDVLRS